MGFFCSNGGADGVRRLWAFLIVLSLAIARVRDHFRPPVGHSPPCLFLAFRQLKAPLLLKSRRLPSNPYSILPKQKTQPRKAGFFALMAGRTGFEPATFGSTVRRSSQLNYRPKKCTRSYIIELFARQLLYFMPKYSLSLSQVLAPTTPSAFSPLSF